MQIKQQVEKYIDNYSTDATQAKAMKLALTGTGIIWFILMIILAVSPGWHKQKHYKTVRIILEPAVEKVSDKKVASEAASAASASQTAAAMAEKALPAPEKKSAPAQKPVAQKPVQQTKPESKPAEKPAASSAPKAAIKYKQSVEDMMNRQSSTSANKSVDWDTMDFRENSSSSASAESSSVNQISSSNALSGSAASSAVNDGAVKSTSAKAASTSASSSTSSALSNISQTIPVIAEGLSSSIKTAGSKTGDGKTAIAMSDGSSRVLLEPAKPYIEISDENARLIDSSRNVVITFRILASGSVPAAGIDFTPRAALPLPVQSEIREQISKWRFATASTDGQARFEHSIIKR